MFLGPFIVLGWPIETVTSGFSSWFGHAGALSPFNFVTIETGTEQLPSTLWWTGYLVILGTVVLTVYAMMRKPENTLRYALLSAAVFFTLRPWNSEQNVVILLTLFILLSGATALPVALGYTDDLCCCEQRAATAIVLTHSNNCRRSQSSLCTIRDLPSLVEVLPILSLAGRSLVQRDRAVEDSGLRATFSKVRLS